MLKHFLSLISLAAIIFISPINETPLKAAFVRQPPTAEEIQTAYDNCFKHDCEDFAEWSIEAYEACSQGDRGDNDCDGNYCDIAREILEEIISSQVTEPFYDHDNEMPHSFRSDDEIGTP